MAQQLQAEEQEELTIEEKSKLFVQLLEARKKHFAALIAKEKRNKPPTKAQKRNKISTYLKNMAGYKHNQLKNKSFDDIQKLFNKEMKGSSKRAGDELQQKSSKKQKVDDDKEKEELKQCFEIVLEDEDTVEVIPLAVKPAPIVDWKIHKEEKKSYYQIMRADGSFQIFRVFNQMLKGFDIEDLETMYRLVKDRYKSTKPVGDDRVLWGNLLTIFEPSVEDKYGELMLLRRINTVGEVQRKYSKWLMLLVQKLRLLVEVTTAQEVQGKYTK
ncbi:hypothetical protein Tco_0754024 [Tanacetum coccineum]